MFSELHPRIQYRWGRTINTRSHEVLLLPSFAKERPIPLKWDNRRQLYISEERVATPCGRHGAKLLVDGATYPCDNFTVASPMFEVSIYTKDSSSDEDQVPSLVKPRLRTEVRQSSTELLNRTSVYGSNIRRPLNPRPRWSSNEELRLSDNLLRKKLRFGDSLISNVRAGSHGQLKTMEGTRVLPVGGTSTAVNGIGNFGRCLSTGSLSNIPCRDEVYSSLDDFKTGSGMFGLSESNATRRLLADGVSERDYSSNPNRPVCRNIITSVKVSSDPLLPHQRYVKKSVEMTHNANQVFKSFEKSLAIVDNATEVCSGSERLVEVGVSGHETMLNVVTVQLRDSESQTGDYEDDGDLDDSQPLELPRELDEIEDSSHLFMAKTAAPFEDDVTQPENRTKQDEGAWDNLKIETDKEVTFDDGPPSFLASSPLPVGTSLLDLGLPTDEASTDDKFDGDQSLIDELPMEVCLAVSSDETDDSHVISEAIDDYVLTPAVSALAKVGDKSVLGSCPDVEDQIAEELDGSEGLMTDGVFHEAVSFVEDEPQPLLVDSESSEAQSGIPTEADSGADEVKKLIGEEVIREPERPAVETDLSADESLEEVKERVCDRERQVRRLQQEILLLEDSHRYLYRERAQLLQEAQNAQSHKLQSEDTLKSVAVSEDKRSLSEEVKALRLQVTEQERANSTLEWEVKELRTRLDSNDPTEVAQLLEEMRSLRDELALLADRNRDLYDEITALREENGRLRRRQSLEAAAMARAPALLAFVASSSDATQRISVPPTNVTFPNIEKLGDSRGQNGAESRLQGPDDDQLPHRGDSIALLHSKSSTHSAEGHGVDAVFKGPEVMISSNSESEGTQYQDLPVSSTEFLASRQTPDTVLRVPSPVADVMTQTPTQELKSDEFEELSDGRRSFGVQTLPTEAEDADVEQALSPGSFRTSRRRNLSGRDTTRRKVHHHHSCSRAPYGHHVSSSLGFVQEPSSDSGSSTDSLLTEADNIIRESMHQLLDGVKDHGGRTSTPRTSKRSDRHVTRSVFSSSTSVPASGGSGDRVRTISYQASVSSSSGPFIPKGSNDLRPGYVVRFMHPHGGVAQGTVRYVGMLPGEVDTLVGLELARPTGNCDGQYGGLRLFECETNQGIFISLRKIVLAWPT